MKIYHINVTFPVLSLLVILLFQQVAAFSSSVSKLTMNSNSLDGEDIHLTTYESLLRKIYFIANPKNGIQNMKELYEAMGKPLDEGNTDISVLHVAGTNGKGSVCIKLAKSLEYAGYKVGMLISPHIASYRERMSINGKLISENEVSLLLPRILSICEEQEIKATFFEITTALAFLYFVESKVDVIVLETGLGGLLDATNVINAPALSIVTSIGLEHTALLGNTVEAIAEHKAGIIKKGKPALVGPNVPHATIRRCAKERGAEGYYTCDDILGPEDKNNDSESCVDYDIENSRIAKAALNLLIQKRKDNSSFPSTALTAAMIEQGISHRPSCRFEVIESMEGDKKCTTILDIAHNPPALETLVAKLKKTYPDKVKRFVIGFSADKDIKENAKLLLSIVPDPSHIHLVEAVNLRAAKVEDILDQAPELRNSNNALDGDRSITTQVRCAKAIASANDELLVVCGSVFLMAEARQALGINEPRDSENITKVAGKGMMKCKQEKSQK